MTILSIQEISRRIQVDEDVAAFNALYKQYMLKLLAFAHSFLDDREPAEEIVNDVFIKIWTGRKNLDQIKNLQVYLYVAVKNACLNQLRSVSNKRNNEEKLKAAYYFNLSVDPSELLISKDLAMQVSQAVNELPVRCKLIFKMVKEDDLSSKEVAVILGLSNKTVFAQLSIALKRIDQALKGK